MTTDSAPAKTWRFNLHELAGSLGDLGTFLPLTVALAAATGLDLGWMFIAAGLMNIASGIAFRLPIPVQPMKAIAAVAIAEGLSAGGVVAAGWLMGITLTVLAIVGLMPWIDRLIPKPVVRGIQLGIGLKLLITGGQWLSGLPWFDLNGIAVSLGLAGLLGVGVWRGWALVLPVFLLGFVLIAWQHGEVYDSLTWSLPEGQWLVPSATEWSEGLWKGALPQLPLTLLNSVIAVCALTHDYFPGRGVSPRRMTLSVGLMNLACVGWSGLPMCHGSGGLAAQYRAGARTGGSVVMLGGIKVLAGILFGASLMPLLAVYPIAVLAPLVGLAGASLAWAGKKDLNFMGWLIAAPIAIVIVTLNTLTGFLLGIGLAAMIFLIQKALRKKEKQG